MKTPFRDSVEFLVSKRSLNNKLYNSFLFPIPFLDFDKISTQTFRHQTYQFLYRFNLF